MQAFLSAGSVGLFTGRTGMATPPVPAAPHEPSGWLGRWAFSPAATVALLLSINLFNYIDRQVLAAVVGEIQKDLHSSDAVTGMFAFVFLISYMCFAPAFGWL